MRNRTLHAFWLTIALFLLIPSTVIAQEISELQEIPASITAELLPSLHAADSDATIPERHTDTEQAQRDRVMFILNHVHDDQREEFEDFVYQRLIPAILQHAQEDPQHRRAFQQTRVLEPTEANDDGTWTYVFLMDPVIEGFSYSFEEAFEDLYSDEEAQQYIQQFQDTLARPQESYTQETSEMW